MSDDFVPLNVVNLDYFGRQTAGSVALPETAPSLRPRLGSRPPRRSVILVVRGESVRCALWPLAGGLLLMLMTACTPTTPGTNPGAPASIGTVISGAAALDWDTATITLPLDRYGMTPQESLVIDAAGSIEFARCALDTESVSPDVIQEATRYLSTIPVTSHWLYGEWDATYVAKYGWQGFWDVPLSWVRTDSDTAETCHQKLVDEGLTVVAATSPVEGSSMTLLSASMQAYDATMANSAFKTLQSQWRSCVADSGYKIDTQYNTAAAWLDPSWSDEQVNQASLAEATCADKMNYTQQVADINAAYQQAYISANQAELVAIRQDCETRLAKAHDILREVGIE